MQSRQYLSLSFNFLPDYCQHAKHEFAHVCIQIIHVFSYLILPAKRGTLRYLHPVLLLRSKIHPLRVFSWSDTQIQSYCYQNLLSPVPCTQFIYSKMAGTWQQCIVGSSGGGKGFKLPDLFENHRLQKKINQIK